MLRYMIEAVNSTLRPRHKNGRAKKRGPV